MKYLTALALTLTSIGLCAVGRGETPFSSPAACGWERSCAKVPLCCPNDYVAKPMPTVVRAPCGGCDDYCRKPLPSVIRAPMGCGNDYCPKTMPVCPPLNRLGWSCGFGCPGWGH